MSDVLAALADLTALRDRDVLDVSLAGALKEMLDPLSVAIYRRVGEPGDERWLLRARLAGDALAASSDPPWVELDALPRLADQPLHERALHDRDWVLLAAGDPAAAAGRGALAVFPLSGEGGTLGVVEVETESPLEATALRLVRSVLRLHCNFQSLLDDSERDTLTGLRNRKTFDREFLKLTTELPSPAAAAAPGGQPGDGGAAGGCWLGVIDIDHFKRVNDVHGHLIGDEVLLMLSRLMTRSFRLSDHLFRFGGEEFVVLMRCADEAQALAAMERLRGHVQAFDFPRAGQVTISIGSAAVRPGEPPSVAFQRADRAVYWAKGHGRNQVCSFAARVASGDLHETGATDAGDVELF